MLVHHARGGTTIYADAGSNRGPATAFICSCSQRASRDHGTLSLNQLVRGSSPRSPSINQILRRRFRRPPLLCPQKALPERRSIRLASDIEFIAKWSQTRINLRRLDHRHRQRSCQTSMYRITLGPATTWGLATTPDSLKKGEPT